MKCPPEAVIQLSVGIFTEKNILFAKTAKFGFIWKHKISELILCFSRLALTLLHNFEIKYDTTRVKAASMESIHAASAV